MRKFPRMRERSKKDRSRWEFEYIKNDSAERGEMRSDEVDVQMVRTGLWFRGWEVFSFS